MIDLNSAFSLATQIGMYGAAALGLYLAARGSFYTVPQQHTGLITRFDQHVSTQDKPGLKVKIPLIDKVYTISQQEYQTDEMLETKTTDDLFVKLPISIHHQVSDPAIFHFEKENPEQLMKKVVAAAVREYTSKKTFQELYDERQEIKQGVLEKVADQVHGFGITINDIVIDEPQASKEVKETFDRVRSSGLEKEAAKNEAEADYIRTVKRAEADKQRNILIGEGVAGFREKIADGYSALRKKLVDDGVNPEVADRFMEEAMRLDTLRDVGDKGNMVIVTTDSASGNRIAEMQTLSKTLGHASEQGNSPQPRPPRAMPVEQADLSAGPA